MEIYAQVRKAIGFIDTRRILFLLSSLMFPDSRDDATLPVTGVQVATLTL